MIDHIIVMAASPSRGMESLTRTRPKAMLPILGKPMIAWVMDTFYRTDIRRFTVVVGEHEGSVVEWLSTKWRQDVQLRFAPQGHQRGTASTLFATRSLIDSPFIITSCDNLVPDEHIMRLAWYFESHPRDTAALSLLYDPQEAPETAGVLLDPRGNVIYISEKPIGAHQDFMTTLPVYGFTPDILKYLDRVPVMEEIGGRVLATAIQMMIDNGQIVGAVQADWSIQLETPEDLLAANMKFLRDMEASSVQSELPPSVQVTPPVYIDPEVVVSNGVHLGPNVYLESGSMIGANCEIKDSVVLGRQISRDQRIEREIVNTDR